MNARERSDLIKLVAHKHRLSSTYSPRCVKLAPIWALFASHTVSTLTEQKNSLSKMLRYYSRSLGSL